MNFVIDDIIEQQICKQETVLLMRELTLLSQVPPVGRVGILICQELLKTEIMFFFNWLRLKHYVNSLEKIPI